MTTDELAGLRRSLGYTQTGMAKRMGLSMRAYQDIEAADGEVKLRHVVMAERIALAAAVELKNPMLALPLCGAMLWSLPD